VLPPEAQVSYREAEHITGRSRTWLDFEGVGRSADT